MNNLINIIKRNKTLFVLGIALLMFVFFSFCPAIDIVEKAKINGFKLLFQGKGLGFARFMSALVIIAPLVIIVGHFVDFKLKGKVKEYFDALCFAGAFLFAMILLMALGKGFSFAWGGWIYLVLALLGIAISCIPSIAKNN